MSVGEREMRAEIMDALRSIAAIADKVCDVTANDLPAQLMKRNTERSHFAVVDSADSYDLLNDNSCRGWQITIPVTLVSVYTESEEASISRFEDELKWPAMCALRDMARKSRVLDAPINVRAQTNIYFYQWVEPERRGQQTRQEDGPREKPDFVMQVLTVTARVGC